MTQIDARGMSCPQPVLMTQKALQTGSTEVTVLVDSKTAKSNVERYLNSTGYAFDTVELADDPQSYKISARKK